MKKIVLSAAAIVAFAVTGLAQNFSFEYWGAVYPPTFTMEDPVGWASFNILNSPFTGSMPLTVTKETTGTIPDAFVAAKITTDVVPSTVLIPNPFTPGQNFDTVGFAAVGKIIIGSPPKLSLGAAMPAGISRPSTLSFSSKAAPMAGDTCFVVAYLTHYNTGTFSRDTIASGQYSTTATTTSFAMNSLTLNYDPLFSTVWADTMIVIASSSVFKHSGAKKGSIFWVDNFVWSGYNSVNEIENTGSVSIFPNPATTTINFVSSADAKLVDVMDIAGRKIGTFSMNANKVSIETSGFKPGMYVYSVINEQNEVINRGKFEVTK